MNTEVMMREILSELKTVKSQNAHLMKMVGPLVNNYKPSPWMTREEVMTELKIQVRRFNELMATGSFKYKGRGDAIQVKRRDVEAYQEGRLLLPKRRSA